MENVTAIAAGIADGLRPQCQSRPDHPWFSRDHQRRALEKYAEALRAAGFAPVKLNMVVMRGVNDDELADFARLSRDTDLHVRFIEFMPMGASSRWNADTYLCSDRIKERLRGLGELIPVPHSETDGPARKGKIDFISRRDRLRLTSEGRLRACLLHDEETDLSAPCSGKAAQMRIFRPRCWLLCAASRRATAWRSGCASRKAAATGGCHGLAGENDLHIG
jgi:molybdenum cofactor biosynthesis enzyme MoaA